MPRTGTKGAGASGGGWELLVLLRRERTGPVVAVERVARRDMADARSEFWFEAVARQGAHEVPVEEVSPEMLPHPLEEAPGVPAVPHTGAIVCTGFHLVGPGAHGEEVCCSFPRACLPTAKRAARKLVDAGELLADDTIYYELCAVPAEDPAYGSASREGTPPRAVVVAAPRKAAPLAVRSTPLAPLLAASEEVAATGSPRDYPVFYTRAARARAEEVARRGASCDPPVETGGLLIGPLCACPDSGELFSVVLDVLEAEHAEATTHSLSFSAQTWTRFRAELRALESDPATRHHRILGQVHGHSFLPVEDTSACADCPDREACTRSSAFLSSADIAFCKSLFPAQPWQLSHVFGLDAFGRGVEAFYGQSRAELVPRGYRLIDRFEP